jgi:hypothetical protein
MPPSTTLVKLSSIIGVAATIFLLDWFYLTYITSHGFELKTQAFTLGSWSLSVPLQWLPVMGILLVSLVSWYEVSSGIFPRRAAPELEPMAKLRLLRVIAFSVALFVCVLYIPYLIGSNWFWTRLSELSKSITQIRDIGLSLLHTDESVMALNPLGQYSLSQILATGAMVLTAWALGRVGRRPRRQR